MEWSRRRRRSLIDASFQLAAVSAADLALIALVAFAASIVGGLAGYGTGLVLPIFLAPVVGVANVIPVMAVGMLLNNGSRVDRVSRRDRMAPRPAHSPVRSPGVHRRCVRLYAARRAHDRFADRRIPDPERAAAPLARACRREHRPEVQRGAGALFGFINGGMTGAGTVLIAILMAAGVQGAALIATDAIISIIMGLTKVALFGSLARLPADLALAGLAIGICTVPGAFVARWLLRHIPLRVHTVVHGSDRADRWRQFRVACDSWLGRV